MAKGGDRFFWWRELGFHICKASVRSFGKAVNLLRADVIGR